MFNSSKRELRAFERNNVRNDSKSTKLSDVRKILPKEESVPNKNNEIPKVQSKVSLLENLRAYREKKELKKKIEKQSKKLPFVVGKSISSTTTTLQNPSYLRSRDSTRLYTSRSIVKSTSYVSRYNNTAKTCVKKQPLKGNSNEGSSEESFASSGLKDVNFSCNLSCIEPVDKDSSFAPANFEFNAPSNIKHFDFPKPACHSDEFAECETHKRSTPVQQRSVCVLPTNDKLNELDSEAIEVCAETKLPVKDTVKVSGIPRANSSSNYESSSKNELSTKSPPYKNISLTISNEDISKNNKRDTNILNDKQAVEIDTNECQQISKHIAEINAEVKQSASDELPQYSKTNFKVINQCSFRDPCISSLPSKLRTKNSDNKTEKAENILKSKALQNKLPVNTEQNVSNINKQNLKSSIPLCTQYVRKDANHKNVSKTSTPHYQSVDSKKLILGKLDKTNMSVYVSTSDSSKKGNRNSVSFKLKDHNLNSGTSLNNYNQNLEENHNTSSVVNGVHSVSDLHARTLKNNAKLIERNINLPTSKYKKLDNAKFQQKIKPQSQQDVSGKHEIRDNFKIKQFYEIPYNYGTKHSSATCDIESIQTDQTSESKTCTCNAPVSPFHILPPRSQLIKSSKLCQDEHCEPLNISTPKEEEASLLPCTVTDRRVDYRKIIMPDMSFITDEKLNIELEDIDTPKYTEDSFSTLWILSNSPKSANETFKLSDTCTVSLDAEKKQDEKTSDRLNSQDVKNSLVSNEIFSEYLKKSEATPEEEDLVVTNNNEVFNVINETPVSALSNALTRLDISSTKKNNRCYGHNVETKENSQTYINKPLTRLQKKRISNISAESSGDEISALQAVVETPCTRYKKRISLLGTPQRPSKTFTIIKDDLITFSPSQ